MSVSIALKTSVPFLSFMRKADALRQKILKILSEANEPLETTEVEQSLSNTRTKILYRLMTLRGDGEIKGKAVGSGKGCWIWWKS